MRSNLLPGKIRGQDGQITLRRLRCDSVGAKLHSDLIAHVVNHDANKGRDEVKSYSPLQSLTGANRAVSGRRVAGLTSRDMG